VLVTEPAEARPLYPDGQILPGRCPVCTGRVLADHGDPRCLWCSRLLVPKTNGSGVIVAWVHVVVAARLSNVGHMEERRTRRLIAAEESRTGVVSRVLLEIPTEGVPAGISKLAKALSLPNALVRECVVVLEEAGYITPTEYRVQRGHRYQGYLRALI